MAKIVVSKKKKKKSISSRSPATIFYAQTKKYLFSRNKKLSLSLSLSRKGFLPRLHCRVKNSLTRRERKRDKDARECRSFLKDPFFFQARVNFLFLYAISTKSVFVFEFCDDDEDDDDDDDETLLCRCCYRFEQ
jgi:hypothetical protein